jgi:hypothetical protein
LWEKNYPKTKDKNIRVFTLFKFYRKLHQEIKSTLGRYLNKLFPITFGNQTPMNRGNGIGLGIAMCQLNWHPLKSNAEYIFR